MRFKKTRSDKENKPKKSNTICKKEVQKVTCSYHKCKKEAVGRISIDLDIKGLCYCKEHKSSISQAVLWFMLGEEKLGNHAMGYKKR